MTSTTISLISAVGFVFDHLHWLYQFLNTDYFVPWLIPEVKNPCLLWMAHLWEALQYLPSAVHQTSSQQEHTLLSSFLTSTICFTTRCKSIFWHIVGTRVLSWWTDGWSLSVLPPSMATRSLSTPFNPSSCHLVTLSLDRLPHRPFFFLLTINSITIQIPQQAFSWPLSQWLLDIHSHGSLSLFSYPVLASSCSLFSTCVRVPRAFSKFLEFTFRSDGTWELLQTSGKGESAGMPHWGRTMRKLQILPWHCFPLLCAGWRDVTQTTHWTEGGRRVKPLSSMNEECNMAKLWTRRQHISSLLFLSPFEIIPLSLTRYSGNMKLPSMAI